MSELVGTVRQLLLYTNWADRRILKAVAAVSPEDLSRETGTSFRTLLGTLGHILWAQRTWFARFESRALEDQAAAQAFPDLVALGAAWDESAAELGFLVAALTAEQLQSEITWTNSKGVTSTRPLWQTMIHLVNHSTYHRGQAVSLLRQLGYGAPATDFTVFLSEQSP